MTLFRPAAVGGASPTRTGTAAQLDASAGDGSIAATVPADCNMVVAFWHHYDESGGEGVTLTGLTLNGVAFTVRSQTGVSLGAPTHGVGVATLPSPATGSQTVAWTWSDGTARDEGGKIILVWVKDGNTSDPFRDADSTAQSVGTNVELILTSAATDLVLAMATSAQGTNPAISGTVFINNAVLNAISYDASEVTAGAATTTITMTGEDYSTMAAIALKAA